jgi:hypothetical protein
MEDQPSFFNFLRMSPEMFDELLNKVGPRIRRVDLWVACFNEKILTEVRIFGGILFRICFESLLIYCLRCLNKYIFIFM